MLFRESEIPSEVYTLFDGWVFRFKLLPDGRRQILSFLLPGDFLVPQALRRQPLRFSVQALTDVTLCVFDAGEVTRVVLERPLLLRQLEGLCVRDSLSADDRLTDIGRRSAQERIARLILEFEFRLGIRNLVNGNSFPFPLRQEHIGDALGLTKVHVSRTLGSLRRQGLIALTGNYLVVRDRVALMAIAGLRDQNVNHLSEDIAVLAS